MVGNASGGGTTGSWSQVATDEPFSAPLVSSTIAPFPPLASFSPSWTQPSHFYSLSLFTMPQPCLHILLNFQLLHLCRSLFLCPQSLPHYVFCIQFSLLSHLFLSIPDLSIFLSPFPFYSHFSDCSIWTLPLPLPLPAPCLFALFPLPDLLSYSFLPLASSAFLVLCTHSLHFSPQSIPF